MTEILLLLDPAWQIQPGRRAVQSRLMLGKSLEYITLRALLLLLLVQICNC